MKMMRFWEIRQQITEIDLKIIDLLSERMSLVPNLVKYKKENDQSIFQPERETQMHNRYWKTAVEKQINPEFVRRIFGIIIDEMRRLQYEVRDNE